MRFEHDARVFIDTQRSTIVPRQCQTGIGGRLDHIAAIDRGQLSRQAIVRIDRHGSELLVDSGHLHATDIDRLFASEIEYADDSQE